MRTDAHPYRTALVPPPPARAPWWLPLLARLARRLPLARWAWVRRALGGHWEPRWSQGRPWWLQLTECGYQSWPPGYPCEDHGPVRGNGPLARCGDCEFWGWPCGTRCVSDAAVSLVAGDSDADDGGAP